MISYSIEIKTVYCIQLYKVQFPSKTCMVQPNNSPTCDTCETGFQFTKVTQHTYHLFFRNINYVFTGQPFFSDDHISLLNDDQQENNSIPLQPNIRHYHTSNLLTESPLAPSKQWSLFWRYFVDKSIWLSRGVACYCVLHDVFGYLSFWI
ncbi:Hypothetical_protein [Hexamita inflata]|uniref:Hypothetical_protein n=1 Tax=Hexamita inflata TaxID=28002 RepID=A0AA86RFV2_9EUKA|nr:Hypothetical protein HINF_LOCUS64610 [Hexamita inflata]CAI9976969.1 Hypothetical protein HINF_LOCUS64614 [Hexamita inflata]